MPTRLKNVPIVVGILLSALAPLEAQQRDLTYNTIVPCKVVDTRVAGGALAANETRIFSVVGSSSMAGQGGSGTGCGVPGFSNGIARVQAVAINVVAINPAGAGHLLVGAADVPVTTSFLNYSTGITVANTGQVAVAQTSGVGDIKITAGSNSTQVVVSVVGYYTRFGETIVVGPEGTQQASGTALLNAVTSIADNSATKPYLIKIEPGIYDLGDNRLQMKPFVDIEGSGRNVTIVQGAGNSSDTGTETGVIAGASSAELRNLTLKGVGSSSRPFVIPFYTAYPTLPTIRAVAILSSGGTHNWGIRSFGSPLIEDVSVTVSSSGELASGITQKGPLGNLKVRRTEISVTHSTSGQTTGIFGGCFCGNSELRDVRIDVSGTVSAYGLYEESPPDGFGTLTIENSTIVARDASTTVGSLTSYSNLLVKRSTLRALGSNSTGLSASFGDVKIDHSEIAGSSATVSTTAGALIGATSLEGGSVAGGSVSCAGVYDENYTFYPSTCP